MKKSVLRKIEKIKSKIKENDYSFISQNCIGGVIYKDIGKQFLSPTINLYFDAKDFIKFVNNLEEYLKKEINIYTENGVIVGELDDIKLYFLHYHQEEEAKEKWNIRKNRILKENIFVICTDRDGFDQKCFEDFRKIKYPKVLITRNEDWKDEEFVIYLPKYKNCKYIPDTIPDREFYRYYKITKLINNVQNK